MANVLRSRFLSSQYLDPLQPFPTVIRTLLKRPSAKALYGTLAGSAPGLLLPFAISAHFGVGRLTDAYFLGLTMATLVAGLFDAVLQTNVTPVLQNEKRGGRAPLLTAVRKTLLQACAVSTTSYLVFGMLATAAIVSGRSDWTGEQRETCLTVAALLGVFVTAVTCSSILSAALYALGDFVTPTATVALRSAVQLAGLVAIGHDAHAITLLAGLLISGEALRVIMLAVRLGRRARNLPAGQRQQTIGLWRTAIPHGASMLVSSANPAVDRTIASSLGPGSVTLLDLGEKVLFAPLTALSSLFVIVAGTRWAEMGLADIPRIRSDFRRTVTYAVAVSVLVVALVGGAVVVGAELVGPHFLHARTLEIQQIVLLLLVGLPAGIVISLGARFLVAIRHTRILPAFAAYGFIVNVAADLVGARLMGVQGVALASSVMRWADATLYLVVCSRLLRAPAPKRRG